ncbi:SRPBCC family protein [Salinactinospora qingdaonensis]|uniref:Carbon monoxide dehydrogenase subunit G n=1 Tax=Salinactinospora qingdaonensis TaxID=702744 RepID=A0ABP7GDY6_9ACTN
MSTQLNNEFTVPVPIERAWAVLLDVERIAPCMPGATLESAQDDTFTGRVKVKVGPITVTYRGQARIISADESARLVTVDAEGKESRGTGTAAAKVTAALRAEDGTTRVTVDTDLNVTGRVAQFGRGVMADVSAKLVDKFAANLAAELERAEGAEQPAAAVPEPRAEAGAAPQEQPAPVAQEGAAAPVAEGEPKTQPPAEAPGPVPTRPAAEREGADSSLNLFDVAAGPLLKRALPAIGIAAALVAVVVWWRKRHTAADERY